MGTATAPATFCLVTYLLKFAMIVTKSGIKSKISQIRITINEITSLLNCQSTTEQAHLNCSSHNLITFLNFE